MKKLYDIFKQIVLIFLIIFIFIIFVGSILNKKGFSFLDTGNTAFVLLTLVGAILLLFVIDLINRLICKNKFCQKYLKFVFLAILIISQIILIYHFRVQLITDAYVIIDQALAIVNNISSKVDPSFYYYFKIYGNNNFYLYFVMFFLNLLNIMHISDYLLSLTIFNVILIDLSIIFTYLITKKISDEKRANLVFILCCMNPLNYFLIFWPYTLTFSIPFVIGFILLYYIYKDKELVWQKVLLSICLSLVFSICYLLRPIIVIPFTAVVICFIFAKGSIKDKFKKNIIPLLIFLIVCVGTIKVFNHNIDKYVEDKTGFFPVYHWVMMGLTENGVYSQDDVNYSISLKDSESMKEGEIDVIKKRLKDMKLSGLTRHMINKVQTTWSDGNSAYYDRMSYNLNENNSLYKWVAGSKRDLVVLYSNVYRVVLLLVVLLYLVKLLGKHIPDDTFMIILTLFGSICFYLIWEAKDVYSYPFIPLLIILFALGFERNYDSVYKKVPKRYFLLISFFMLIVLFGYKYNLTIEKKEINNNTFVVHESSNTSYKLYKKDPITQTFYTNKPFNQLSFRTTKIKDNDSKYHIDLYKDKKLIKDYTVTSNDIDGWFVDLDVPRELTGKGKYSISISFDKGNEDSINWIYVRSLVIDNYKGDFYINNEKNTGDLFIKTVDKKEIRYCSSVTYWFLFIIIVGIMYLEYNCLYKNKNKKSHS